MPGVKSMGPASSRVNGRMVRCSGGFVGRPQALNSCPRAPSRLSMLGQVRRRPVSFTGSCATIEM